ASASGYSRGWRKTAPENRARATDARASSSPASRDGCRPSCECALVRRSSRTLLCRKSANAPAGCGRRTNPSRFAVRGGTAAAISRIPPAKPAPLHSARRSEAGRGIARNGFGNAAPGPRAFDVEAPRSLRGFAIALLRAFALPGQAIAPAYSRMEIRDQNRAPLGQLVIAGSNKARIGKDLRQVCEKFAARRKLINHRLTVIGINFLDVIEAPARRRAQSRSIGKCALKGLVDQRNGNCRVFRFGGERHGEAPFECMKACDPACHRFCADLRHGFAGLRRFIKTYGKTRVGKKQPRELRKERHKFGKRYSRQNAIPDRSGEFARLQRHIDP